MSKNGNENTQFPPWKESDFCTFDKIHEDQKFRLTLEFKHVVDRKHPTLNGAVLDREGGFNFSTFVEANDLPGRIYNIICLNGDPDESTKAARALERRSDLTPEENHTADTLEHN